MKTQEERKAEGRYSRHNLFLGRIVPGEGGHVRVPSEGSRWQVRSYHGEGGFGRLGEEGIITLLLRGKTPSITHGNLDFWYVMSFLDPEEAAELSDKLQVAARAAGVTDEARVQRIAKVIDDAIRAMSDEFDEIRRQGRVRELFEYPQSGADPSEWKDKWVDWQIAQPAPGRFHDTIVPYNFYERLARAIIEADLG